MSQLGDLQRAFARLLPRLIDEAHEMGFEVVMGYAYRSPKVAERLGFKNSNHTRCLAVDLELFKDGKFLKKTEDHRPLGEWWECQHPEARWGGRFNDGNHYSFNWRGVS